MVDCVTVKAFVAYCVLMMLMLINIMMVCRVINSEASSNNALFLNNIIVNGRGLHFDLQHHPDRETSPDLSDGATVPTSTCTCNEANECLCSRDNVPTSSCSSQGHAAQAVHPGHLSTSEDMVSMILSIEIILKNLSTPYSLLVFFSSFLFI